MDYDIRRKQLDEDLATLHHDDDCHCIRCFETQTNGYDPTRHVIYPEDADFIKRNEA